MEQRGYMSRYDEQYQIEKDLFGKPYPEFVGFVEATSIKGSALDLGCGQGRDALMLAAQGLSVTGVDESRTGVSQMLNRARGQNLSVTGIIGDHYRFEFVEDYDVIVLDSILHFGKDTDKELVLLDRVFAHTKEGGYVFIFVHKSRSKEKRLKELISGLSSDWQIVVDRYIDYTYEERQTGFRSESQFNMVVVRKRTSQRKDAQGQSEATVDPYSKSM
jgi:SAM-dependent methyltransferase